MTRNRLLVFAAISVFAFPGTGPVHAVQLETGTWEVTMLSHNPLTGEPISETSVECIEDNKFDPSEELMAEKSCTVTEKQESDNSVSWKIACGGGDMPAFQGEGIFTSQGGSAQGKMKMTMTMGANTMEMHTEWNGKRISSKCGDR
jgi:hypothetical protein